MKNRVLFVCVVLALIVFVPFKAFNQNTEETKEIFVNFSDEEIKLYKLINKYRAKKGLSKIPLSVSLSYVAQQHCIDLIEHQPNKKKRCNMHSWSNEGNWGGCCYTVNHKKASCIWDKPRELTNYKGNGYEIAFWRSTSVNLAEEALKGWKKSKGHNDTMVNRRVWKKMEWNAMGVGIVDGYAMVWFGAEEDPEPSPELE